MFARKFVKSENVLFVFIFNLKQFEVSKISDVFKRKLYCKICGVFLPAFAGFEAFC